MNKKRGLGRGLDALLGAGTGAVAPAALDDAAGFIAALPPRN